MRYRIGVLGPGWNAVPVDGGDLAFHRSGMGTISVEIYLAKSSSTSPWAVRAPRS